MATFFTKITLQEIVEKTKGFFEGTIILDVEELNIFQLFGFIIDPYNNIVIYKDGYVFAEKVGTMSNGKRKRTEAQKVILNALEIVFVAYSNKLQVKKWARITIERGRWFSIKIATPDLMRKSLMQACM